MNKNFFIIGIVLLFVLFIILVNIHKNNNFSNENVVFNEVDNKYTMYDNNGREITTVTENEKYKLKIYEINPDFEEIKEDFAEAGNENII